MANSYDLPPKIRREIIWAPQAGPQKAYFDCPIPEILFGGSRGGGKSDGILGKWAAKSEKYGKGFNAVFFRQEMPQQDDLTERGKDLFGPLGAEWIEYKKTFNFRGGGRLRFRPLESVADANKYQGQNLCVAVGTLLRMADGSLRPIEAIHPGDVVATLEGPRRVKATTPPYEAPCVSARVLNSSGELIGEQVHPVWHPVLTTAGISRLDALSGYQDPPGYSSIGERTSSRTSRTLHTSAPLHAAGDVHAAACEEHQQRVGRVFSAWSAFSEDGQTCCTGSSGAHAGPPPPVVWSVPVVLHVPAHQSGQTHRRSSPGAAILRHFLGRFSGLSPGSSLVMRTTPNDPPRPREPERSSQDHGGVRPSARACARRLWQKVLGFPDGYLFGLRFCGAQPPSGGETGQDGIPSRPGAAGWSRSGSSGVSGTTRTHTQRGEPSWVHPYSGAAHRLTEAVTWGTMECHEIGSAWVTDLCVESANHYIGVTGLINKNSDAAVEEAGNYPSPQPIDMLHGAMRSVSGTPVQLTLTANPGGAGHTWIKHRYIDPAPLGMVPLKRLLPGGAEHTYIYIPSRVQDNLALLTRDPTYINRLHLVGSDALVKAWLTGDWNVVAGAFFDKWDNASHVIAPFVIPPHWVRFGSFDWGSAKPFCMQWWAISDGSTLPDGRQYPTGAMILYREWYGASAPNVGLRMSTSDVALGIRQRERGEKIDYRVADPACWKVDGGPSHAEVFANHGLMFRRADNSRIAGWTQARDRILGLDGIPMLYAFSTAIDLIRTLPSMQHDTVRPEDIDTDGEDHSADAMRYALMSRPWTRRAGSTTPSRGLSEMTLDEMWRLARPRNPAEGRI